MPIRSQVISIEFASHQLANLKINRSKVTEINSNYQTGLQKLEIENTTIDAILKILSSPEVYNTEDGCLVTNNKALNSEILKIVSKSNKRVKKNFKISRFQKS